MDSANLFGLSVSRSCDAESEQVQSLANEVRDAVCSGNASPHIPVLKLKRKQRRDGSWDSEWEHPVKPFSWKLAKRENLSDDEILEWRTAWCSYRKRMNDLKPIDCPFIAKHILCDKHDEPIANGKGGYVISDEWGVYTRWTLRGYTSRNRKVTDAELRKMKSSEPVYGHKLEKFADASVRNNVMFGHNLGDRWGNPLEIESQLLANAREGPHKLEQQDRISGMLKALSEKGWEVRD